MKKELITYLTSLSLIGSPLYAKEEKTRLEVYSRPRMGLASVNRPAVWTMYAEIKGPETEEFYCPKVRWINPDRTKAEIESDCPPFEERNLVINKPECRPYIKNREIVYPDCYSNTPFGYPRKWSRKYGTHSVGNFEVCVELEKNGKVFRKSCGVFTSAGDSDNGF